MINTIVSYALRVRFIVVALATTLVIIGAQGLKNAPLDVFPEFAPPLVEVQTEAPGLSALEVEALISAPLENAINGVSGLDAIRSKSVPGLSSVKVIFERDVDLLEVRQLVQERVTLAALRLPAVANAPVLLSPLSSTSRVLKVGMQSSTLTQVELSTLATWTVRPRLLSVPGVANVAVWGQRDREFQVRIDPAKLIAYGVTIDQVKFAASQATSVVGGAFVEGATQRFNVVHSLAIQSVDDLAGIVIENRNGAALTLGEVANIREGTPPPIGDGIIDGKPGILLIVEKHPTGNTIDVTAGVEAALSDLAPALVGVDVDPTIFRPATYIENSISNLNDALLIGCILVVLVLMFFLYEWRSALISITAIPLSLLAAALVLKYAGGVINTMVLAGLVIALGEVVDDAIIDVENIMRRLRQNAQKPKPEKAVDVVFQASIEVRTAVVFGSLIVAAALVPVFTLGGLTGTFFKPLALSYITAILASLVVALTVTPALSLILLPKSAGRRQVEAPLTRWLKGQYRKLISRNFVSVRTAVFGIVVSITAVVTIVPQMGQELLPKFKEYDFLMHWLERPGTSLDAMNRITIRAANELQEVPGVRNFGAHVGRAEVADEVVGIDFTELWISLDPSVDYDATVETVQEIVDGYPGLYRDLLTYLRERVKEVLTGSSASIVVRLYGPELDVLIAKAKEIERTLATVEGVADLHVQQLTYIPQIEIRFRPEKAALLGLTPGDVRRATSVLINGEQVGQVYLDQKILNVVVRGEEKFTSSIEAVRKLQLTTPLGQMVPLTAVADVYIAPSPNAITREAASRRIDINLNPIGRSLDEVAKDVEARLADIGFENGYYPEVLGEFAELRAAQSRLMLAVGGSLIAIFLVLHALFQSLRIATIVFLGLPAALVGGVIGAVLGGGIISLGSLIGFITVLGISARTSVMLVSHFRHLEEEEGLTFGPDLVRQGSEERLVPILMTILTTALALAPIIVGGIQPGHEIEHPMAVVIVGGLVSSAVINLFIIPPLYLQYGKTNSGPN